MIVEDIITGCRELGIDQLRELNSRVVDLIHAKRDVELAVLRIQYYVGQKVTTTGRKSGDLGVGIIEKINPKKAIVNFNGVRYTVPFEMLVKQG